MFSKISKEHKWLMVILLAALTVRIVFFINDKPWERDYKSEKVGYGDALEYQRLAEKIIETGSYPENFFLDTYRTPVFPLYVASFYYAFGIKPHLVLFSHIFLNLIIIFFIYLISIKLFENKSVAIIAAALYAFEPNIIKLVTEFGTETLHATFLTVSIYFFISGLKDNKIKNICISSVFFGLTALTRPVNLYFYLLCIILIFFYPNQQLKQKLKTALLFVFIYFLSISPWMYRNYRVYDHFSTNAFQGTAVYYNAIITKAKYTGISNDSIINEFVTNVDKICSDNNIKNPFEVDKQKEIYGYNYIKEHLNTYAALHIKGMVNFFLAPVNNPKYAFKNRLFIGSYLFIIYTLFFIGLFVMFKNKMYYFSFFFLSLIFYFWFITGMIGLSRYRMPTTAFYLIISAYGIYYIFGKLKDKINFIKK